MKLYLVVGENDFPLGTKTQAWQILGLFKNEQRAWGCALLNFDRKTIVEIETDFFDDKEFKTTDILSGLSTKLRMIRITDLSTS